MDNFDNLVIIVDEIIDEGFRIIIYGKILLKKKLFK